MTAQLVLPFTRRPYAVLGEDVYWACDGDLAGPTRASLIPGQLWERVAEGKRAMADKRLGGAIVGRELIHDEIERLPVGAVVERAKHPEEAFIRIDEPGLAPWRYRWPNSGRPGLVLYTHAEIDAQHVRLRSIPGAPA